MGSNIDDSELELLSEGAYEDIAGINAEMEGEIEEIKTNYSALCEVLSRLVFTPFTPIYIRISEHVYIKYRCVHSSDLKDYKVIDARINNIKNEELKKSN